MCARRPSAVHTANKAANLRGKQLCFANCAALVNGITIINIKVFMNY